MSAISWRLRLIRQANRLARRNGMNARNVLATLLRAFETALASYDPSSSDKLDSHIRRTVNKAAMDAVLKRVALEVECKRVADEAVQRYIAAHGMTA